ncbi:hypothetical protein CWR48_02885 [Oceanobacillus arenosus]|uniref:DUF960 domain-containing protein n=1 Tax=Oceanobacillus arenosus TaxID=1229153 RepID=A0A3D8Q0M4_9BACI|nr:DUF960 domain-containing protein [Oceanobacillus arenosus]RDW21367.1 hypothetical protein CWR48_02885 [Oceanobacillus arenosus]
MFESTGKRYMTRAIADELHIEIQLLLWHLIDELKSQGSKLDYLQVFELSVLDGKQMIVHRQEVPEREQKWSITLKSTNPITEKVWCIDDGKNQMMLFPSDY